MKRLIESMKNKYVVLFILIGFMYQCIMLGIFLPTYAYVDNSIENLKVAIINHDDFSGKNVAASLAGQLPCQVIESFSIEEALNELEKLKIALVIEIPQDFTENITTGHVPQVNYYQNQRLAAITETVVNQMTTTISQSLTSELRNQKCTAILVGAGISQDEAQALAQAIDEPIINNMVINDEIPDGMHNVMAPLFLNLAAYVFGLIGTALLAIALEEMKRKMNDKFLFLSEKFAVLLAVILLPVVGIGLLYLCGNAFTLAQIGGIWLTIALVAFISVELVTILMGFIGQGGTFLAVIFLLIQIITGTGIIAREQMLSIFRIISYGSPLYYGINGIKCFMFGGADGWNFVAILALMAMGLVTLDGIILWVKGSRAKKHITEMHKEEQAEQQKLEANEA